MVTAKVRKYK